MLGTIARDHVVKLAEHLAAGDGSELLRYAQSLEQWAPDYAQVLDELASLLVRVAMKQTVADFEGDDLYAPELLDKLAKSFSPEDVQLYYQTAILGRRDLALISEPRVGFEMTLLRMLAFRPTDASVGASGPQGSRTEAQSSRSGAQAARDAISSPARSASSGRANSSGNQSTSNVHGSAGAPVAGQSHRSRESVGANMVSASGAALGASGSAAPGADITRGSWGSILSQLELAGSPRQLANHCTFVGHQGNVVKLGFDPRSGFVRTQGQVEKLAQALSKYFGEAVRVEFEALQAGQETPAQAGQRASVEELDSARQSLESDPGVQALREKFGATLLPDSVRPVK
jgi:DNA polymerase-3 subunit gamma/tau